MQGNALQIVQQTAMELGLPTPAELVTSQEATSIQLLALLNSAGNELCGMFDWEFLLKNHQINTVANQQSYAKPSDLNRIMDQTVWDKTGRRPAYGPVSPQGWQVLNNALVSTGPFVRYRVAGSKLEFLPIPTSSDQVFNYTYISDAWVNSYLNPNAYSQFITNDLDTVLFDFWLMVKFLKMKMWQAKGLDSTTYTQDFTRVFDAYTGHDHGAPILSVSRVWQAPYLNMGNVPDGNWGQ